MLPIFLFPGLPMLILILYFFILRFFKKKYSIGKRSNIIHLLSLIIGFIIFTTIFMYINPYPYNVNSEYWVEEDAELNILFNFVIGAVFSGLSAVFLHFAFFYMKHMSSKPTHQDM